MTEMWNGLKDPADNFQEEDEEIYKAKTSQTDSTKSALASLLHPHSALPKTNK